MKRIIRIFIPLITMMGVFLWPAVLRAEYAPDHPEYSRLTSRALGMGGACVAWIDDASSIFHNPAGLGKIRNLAISHAHSRNHLPGTNDNLDQLDSDPTSFVIPLSYALFGYPIGAAAAGWSLQGEYGYNYDEKNDPAFPRERFWSLGPAHKANGAGFQLWPLGWFGFSHVVHEDMFSDQVQVPEFVKWRRSGEGGKVGIQQAIAPGIQWGIVYDQMDYDYLPYRDQISGERIISLRTGWCIKPTAWLTIAWDREKISRKEFPLKQIRAKNRVFSGVEINLGSWFQLRWGSFDGHRTFGWSWKIGPWRSDSAKVDDLMNKMVINYPQGWRDVHITGFNFGN